MNRGSHRNRPARIILAIILVLILLGSAGLAVNYYCPDVFSNGFNISKLDISKITFSDFKSVINKTKVVFPSNAQTIMVYPGEEYTFDLKVTTEKLFGGTSTGELTDTHNVNMFFSDTNIVTRTSYNTIKLSDSVKTGVFFTVTIKYQDQSTIYSLCTEAKPAETKTTQTTQTTQTNQSP